MHTYIQLHTYIHTLHYITLHYITLHYITLHYITLHYITLHTYIHMCMHACNVQVFLSTFVITYNLNTCLSGNSLLCRYDPSEVAKNPER